VIEIEIDRHRMAGSVNFVGADGQRFTPERGAQILAERASRPDLAPHPRLPADTRLWALLQNASGGIWGGCVYDPEAIEARLKQR